MNASTILDLQGHFQPLIKKRARAYRLDLTDAQQEAASAICESVMCFDSARGSLDAWVATSIDTKLKRLAYGHDMNPLMFAGELAEDLEMDEKDELQRWRSEDPPAVHGILGRLLQVAEGGASTTEMAHRLGLSKRRVEQLISEFCRGVAHHDQQPALF